MVKSSTIEDIYNELLEHQGDLDYFSGDMMVSIGYPMESLKEFHLRYAWIINHNRCQFRKTRKFIQESDVVLIFNANHITKDVNEELANVARRSVNWYYKQD